jgi:hypothetical protein
MGSEFYHYLVSTVAVSSNSDTKLCVYSPNYTLLLPYRVPPYTDGHCWARQEGFESHHGLIVGEELTDDESDSG